MRNEVTATRFDVKGRTVENVRIEVKVWEDRVTLFIDGEKLLKSYTMTRESWDKLIS